MASSILFLQIAIKERKTFALASSFYQIVYSRPFDSFNTAAAYGEEQINKIILIDASEITIINQVDSSIVHVNAAKKDNMLVITFNEPMSDCALRIEGKTTGIYVMHVSKSDANLVQHTIKEPSRIMKNVMDNLLFHITPDNKDESEQVDIQKITIIPYKLDRSRYKYKEKDLLQVKISMHGLPVENGDMLNITRAMFDMPLLQDDDDLEFISPHYSMGGKYSSLPLTQLRELYVQYHLVDENYERSEVIVEIV